MKRKKLKISTRVYCVERMEKMKEIQNKIVNSIIEIVSNNKVEDFCGTEKWTNLFVETGDFLSNREND